MSTHVYQASPCFAVLSNNANSNADHPMTLHVSISNQKWTGQREPMSPAPKTIFPGLHVEEECRIMHIPGTKDMLTPPILVWGDKSGRWEPFGASQISPVMHHTAARLSNAMHGCILPPRGLQPIPVWGTSELVGKRGKRNWRQTFTAGWEWVEFSSYVKPQLVLHRYHFLPILPIPILHLSILTNTNTSSLNTGRYRYFISQYWPIPILEIHGQSIK